MCGIIGIVGVDQLIEPLIQGLSQIERRGYEGTGIHFNINDNECCTIKGEGVPKKVFTPKRIQNLEDRIQKGTIKVGIGHVRYRTSGARKESKQPIFLKREGIAVVHNGNIFGYKDILKELQQRNVRLPRKDYSDTELLARLIANSNGSTLEEKITETIDLVTPTMNIIIKNKDKLYVYKDPTNSHPLRIGRIGKKGFVVASEETALNSIKGYDTEDVKPGQFLVLQKGKKSSIQLYKPWEHRCIFEAIYLATAQNKGEDFKPKLWGKDITEQRKKAGGLLWSKFYQRKNLENCIVVHAPDSAYWAAKGFSNASHIPLSDAIKAETKERGFLQSTQIERERMAAHKYNYDRSKLEGKTVYLIDDSLVRGTTMWEVVKHLRLNGVNELNVGFASSKIHSPCYYGMNFPTYTELAGSHLRKDQIELFYRARFLGYEGSKKKLIRQIKEGRGLKYILKHNKNYLGAINRKKAFAPDDTKASRFTLKYLTEQEMQKAYGDKKHYCQACFIGRHWVEDWYDNKDKLRIKHRSWQHERIAA